MGLALLVLLPVVAVVALGAYGESFGGQSEGRSERGAVLNVVPAAGRPGETLRIEGTGWPPRQAIRLDMLKSASEESVPVRFAGIVASRNGTFVVDAVLPMTLPLAPGSRILIRAAGQTLGEEMVVASAPFEIKGFETEMSITALAAESALALAGARVQVRDDFGMLRAEGMTDPGGSISFQGLPPGDRYEVWVRAPDRRAATISGAGLVEKEVSKLEAQLERAPGERLYVGGQAIPNEYAMELIGVDLAAGLAVTERVQLEPWAIRSGRLSSQDYAPYLVFGTGSTLSPPNAPEGSAMGLSADGLRSALSAIWAIDADQTGIESIVHSGRYLGLDPATREALVMLTTDYDAHIVHFDLVGGGIRKIDRLEGRFLDAYLSPDGGAVVLLDWSSGALVRFELVTGERTVFDIPRIRTPLVTAMDAEGRLYVYSDPGGRLLRVTLDGEVRLLAFVPELSGNVKALAVTPDGSRAVLAPARPGLVFVVDTETGNTEALLPLSSTADVLVFSASVDRLYAASADGWAVYVYSWPEIRLLDTVPLPPKAQP